MSNDYRTAQLARHEESQTVGTYFKDCSSYVSLQIFNKINPISDNLSVSDLLHCEITAIYPRNFCKRLQHFTKVGPKKNDNTPQKGWVFQLVTQLLIQILGLVML